MHTLSPPGWPRPKGFSNGVVADGRQVFVAGQIGWNPERESVESDDLAGQVRQALVNTLAVLAEAGAGPEHIARMTWYVTDMDEYLGAVREVGRAYREVIGPHYPAMALVQVVRLVEPNARVEIETTAVVPTA